ncbi:hypothetical protein K501DRAFT_221294 [Backusella circina FSU 941]|nr:hypothetical protein K501DRAFT_221294 [Backusella circina FSU 941]
MLPLIPTEVLWNILNHLEYQDLDTLLHIGTLAPAVRHHVQTHYPFHYKITSLLRLFESLTPTERQCQETKAELSLQVLQLICEQVENSPKFEHRLKFTELLDIVQQLVVQRVLSAHLKSGLEHDYANLCLQVREFYLHTPSIRALHDPKYRRRSTKYPLAPFLPRDYTWIWRSHCAQTSDVLKRGEVFSSQTRLVQSRFAHFFGSLFDVTSLYLESNLDGCFEECVREALVSGNAEDLLILCVAADRPIDIQEMCMMVTYAGEQLRHYLDTMDNLMTTDPTPQQELRMQQQNQQVEHPPTPPEWLIPDRYKVDKGTILRLKLMYGLYKEKGWRWFP